MMKSKYFEWGLRAFTIFFGLIPAFIFGYIILFFWIIGGFYSRNFQIIALGLLHFAGIWGFYTASIGSRNFMVTAFCLVAEILVFLPLAMDEGTFWTPFFLPVVIAGINLLWMAGQILNCTKILQRKIS